MINDIRYALRTLRQNPGFALVAIISLALGIGANATMFSVADALVLRPLPVPRPSQVVSVRSQARGASPGDMSYPDYLDYRNKTKSFDGLAAFRLASFGFAKSKDVLPETKPGFLASGNAFRVLDVEPQIGRGFRPDEDRVPGRDAVVVIGNELWRTEFGSSPDAVGKTIFLDGVAFTIVGVAPESFTGIDQWFHPAFYVPMAMWPRLAGSPEANFLDKRGDRELFVKGRLKPGISLASANAEAGVIGRWLERAYPDTNRNLSAAVRTEFQARVDMSPFDALLTAMLLGLAGIVLLIACANIANLMLSRAQARSREIAVRLAIGAGRWRLIRQLLTESLAIAFLGGAASLFVAQAGISFFSRIRMMSEVPIVLDLRLDLRVMLCCVLAAVASAVLFGLVPAIQATRTAPGQKRSGDRSGCRLVPASSLRDPTSSRHLFSAYVAPRLPHESSPHGNLRPHSGALHAGSDAGFLPAAGGTRARPSGREICRMDTNGADGQHVHRRIGRT